ncbi:MAG: aminotransferase [Acidobacteria bacterium]|nr:MAG: aminotransferase [Acidobacteriota bacterium]
MPNSSVSLPDEYLSSAEFRTHFPHLAELSHFDSCSQGALSLEMSYALDDLKRSIHLHAAPWGEWMAKVEELRAEFADFINTTPDHIAIVPSASAGAYQVASAFRWDGGQIMTSDLEFPSVANVLHAQQRNGAEIDFIDDRDSAVHAETWISRMTGKTKLVSVPLVSYHDGARPELEPIIGHAREKGVVTFVDAYQGAGTVPLDVQQLQCDYLTTGSLKYLLGLGGVAFLYVRDIAVADKLPEFTGWFGRPDPFAFDPRDTAYAPNARRFESGTPAVPAVYASLAGLRLLRRARQSDVVEHVASMREELSTGVRELGIEVSGPTSPERRGPQVALKLHDPDGTAARLAEEGVYAAPRNDLLRMSLHYYTNGADIERALAALKKLV